MGDRGYIDWTPDRRTETEVRQLLTLIDSYRSRNLPPPTARDLFYDMVGLHGHQKSKSFERKVYRLLRLMRRSKKIGFEDITDDSEAAQTVGNYSGPVDFYTSMVNVAEAYRLDLLANQPRVVEVFTEGAGKVAQLFPLTSQYHVPVRSPGGYDSIKPKRGLALRALREWKETGRETHVLHCGDFDPDGDEIYEVFHEDAHAFLEAHLPEQVEPGEVLVFKRILTSYGQAMALPRDRRATFDHYEVKEQNHRGKRWPYSFTAQLESVGLENILPVVKQEIEALLDLDRLSKDRERSAEQRADIVVRAHEALESAGKNGHGVFPESVVAVVEHLRDIVETKAFWVTEGIAGITPTQRSSIKAELRRQVALRLLREELS